MYTRLPEVRNNFAKIQSIQFEAFAGCLSWWRNRGENERGWPMPVAQVIEQRILELVEGIRHVPAGGVL